MHQVMRGSSQCTLHRVAVANVQTLFKVIIIKFEAFIIHFQICLSLVYQPFSWATEK